MLQTLQYTAHAAAQTMIDYCRMQFVFLHFFSVLPDVLGQPDNNVVHPDSYTIGNKWNDVLFV